MVTAHIHGFCHHKFTINRKRNECILIHSLGLHVTLNLRGSSDNGDLLYFSLIFYINSMDASISAKLLL